MTHLRLSFKIIDVETNFMYTKLEEETLMKCPHGIKNVGPDNALILDQCISGLIQLDNNSTKGHSNIEKD